VGEVLTSRQDLLGGDVLHERLAAEPRLDGHDEDDVEQAAVRLEASAGLRLDREPGRPAGGPDPAQRRLDLGRLDLDVEGDRIAACVEELVDVPERSLIIRWASSGSSVRGRMPLIIFGPKGQVRDEVGRP